MSRRGGARTQGAGTTARSVQAPGTTMSTAASDLPGGKGLVEGLYEILWTKNNLLQVSPPRACARHAEPPRRGSALGQPESCVVLTAAASVCVPPPCGVFPDVRSQLDAALIMCSGRRAACSTSARQS